jgi:hypothetical protein
MSKATILLITLAALGLGSLIGVSLVEKEVSPPTQAVPEADPQTQTIDETPLATEVSRGGAPLFRYFGPEDVSVNRDPFGDALPSALGENYIMGKGEYKSETVAIDLAAEGQTEYKALMQQGGTLVYSWSSDGEEVYYDFHAHDKAFGDDFFTRYAEGEAVSDSGMITAAYNGLHGWYWLNLQAKPLTITLKVTGFYDKIIKIDL